MFKTFKTFENLKTFKTLKTLKFFKIRFFKIFKMIVEHEDNIYKTVITKPIMDGDYYYDCMVNLLRSLVTKNGIKRKRK